MSAKSSVMALGLLAAAYSPSPTAAAENATNCVTLPFEVVSWWPMEGSITDVLDANNPSGINGISFVPGRVGMGALFGALGPDSWVEIPDTGNLQNQQLTAAAWVRPDGPGSNDDDFGGVVIQK